MSFLLFAQDWQRPEFSRAIIDTKTPNRSFYRQAMVYREMGIVNHAFPLALINPELQGLDPHSKTLSREEVAAVSIEIKQNPWYYLREVVRAPAIGDGDDTPVDCNRSIIALYWLFLNHIPQLLIQPRQTGKSFGSDSIMAGLMTAWCQNTKINLLTKDDILRRKNIERVKNILSGLPRYMDLRDRSDSNNTEEITVNGRGNTYTSHVPQASVKNAMKVGRGLTTSIFQVDEGPFQVNIHIALPAALAAMGAAVDKSKAAGAPYGVILTTTAGERDTTEGAYFYNEILQKSAHWTEKFLDAKNEDHLHKLIRTAGRGVLRVNSVFSHRQLGKSDEWLAGKIEESMQSGEDANRDFFNIWTSGNDLNPLPRNTLEQIAAGVRPSEFDEISPIGGYVTRWYIPEDTREGRMNSSSYILSADTSEASGNDDISIVITDIETGEVVAVSCVNETNLLVFVQWLLGWFLKYHRITGIIEARSTGRMIMDMLIKAMQERGIDPFKRLFNLVVQEAGDPTKEEAWEEINTTMSRRDPRAIDRYRRFFGYPTSGSGLYTRDALYGQVLRVSAQRLASKIYDKQITDQILGLVVRNGRIDHPKGAHDDLVIGWLLGQWLLTYGKNLSHYGIDLNKIMSRYAPVKNQTTEEAIQMHEQLLLRARVKEITDRMIKERDDFVSMRLEMELSQLMRQLVFEDSAVFNVDDMIVRAREARRNHNQPNHRIINSDASDMRYSRGVDTMTVGYQPTAWQQSQGYGFGSYGFGR